MEERDRLRTERDAAISRADHLEARIVSLIDAAHSGPIEVPSDMSHEVARIVNAVRINVRMRGLSDNERQTLGAMLRDLRSSDAFDWHAWYGPALDVIERLTGVAGAHRKEGGRG